MTKLIWDQVGSRIFEVGVDHGVLYTSDGTGVPWNGLTSVKENPSGTGVTPYYLDGVKYLNVAGRKEYGGSISAFTYPDEFNEYDGWWSLDSGLSMDEQPRKAFSFSYRTLIGNDIDGPASGYKIHIVYNALAVPSDRDYSSISDEPNPLVFGWDFTTTPQRVISNNVQLPLSHVTIDSRKINPTQLRIIEGALYGNDEQNAHLISLQDILTMFENPTDTLILVPNLVTGMAKLFESDSTIGDLRGQLSDGMHELGDGSRLVETATPGLYLMEL